MSMKPKHFSSVVFCALSALVVPAILGTDLAAQATAESEAATHLRLCQEAVEKGDAEEAVTQGEKATALAPQNAEAFFLLARAYELKIQRTSGFAQLDPAMKFKSALEKTVELDPAHFVAREILLQYYLQAPPIAGGGVDKARAQAAEIAKIDPKQGHRASALVFQKEQQWDKAAEAWKAFLVLDPQNIQAHIALGGVYAQANQFDKARETLLAGLPFTGENRSLHYQLGRLAALSGQDLEAGLGYMKTYLEVEPAPGSPTWADAYWRMGNIYEKMGDKEAASASYKKALEINPDHKNAKDSLAQLEKK